MAVERGFILVGTINDLRRAFYRWRHAVRQPVAGRFQPYTYTLPDRYPWLFGFAAAELGERPNPRILSFGCSRGDEVFSLRKYFPKATIKGIDIDPLNILRCRYRSAEPPKSMCFATAATTRAEAPQSYDAIFCLGVLCHGYLTKSGASRCDPFMHFADFDGLVTDFLRCLRPGGLLFLHATNFRLCDAEVADSFETLLEASSEQMPADMQFDRENRLLTEPRYRAVVFRKRDKVSCIAI